MTDQEASYTRREIRRRRNELQTVKARQPGYSPKADYLWQSMQRLCRELEDAGQPVHVKGEA